MRKYIFAVMLFIAGSGMMTISASGLEIPIKYERYPERTNFPNGYQDLNGSLQPPPGTWKLPAFKSKKPVYVLIKLGDRERLAVIDMQNADDLFYNRYFFDANGNGNLTDDPPIDGKIVPDSNKSYCQVQFSPVDITVEVDGKSLPYSFRPVISGNGLNGFKKFGIEENTLNQYLNAYLRLNCSYRGEFSVGEKKYIFMLGDSNVNGRFDDRLFIPDNMRMYGRRIIVTAGDHIFLSDGESMESSDVQTCGDYLLVNGKLFEMNISTAKGTVTLTEITKGLAPLKLTMSTKRLSLYTEDKKHCLIMYEPGNTIMIPKGKYRLLTYEVFRKDEQGDLWRICAGATAESPWITVDGASEAILTLGEPYTPTVAIPKMSIPNAQIKTGRSSRLSLSFNIEGTGGEFLSELSRISGNKSAIPVSSRLKNRPKEPTYRIVRADGEVVAQGNFEYG
ncbi:hypothetical protein LLG96_00060 [bacterium]|nr:hypothetical protein [bacterium]